MNKYIPMKDRVRSAVVALTGRNIAGLFISFVSMWVVFLYLSPSQFGPIALAQAICFYVTLIATAGIDIVVLRNREAYSDNDVGELYAAHIAIVALFNIAACIILPHLVADPNGDFSFLTIIAISYVIRALATIPCARLESRIEFATQAKADLVSQIAYASILTSLLYSGYSQISIPYALIAASTIYTALVLRAAKLPPRIPKCSRVVVDGLKEGVSLQSSVWIWQLKEFAIPLILRDLGGISAVGVYALANQLVQKLSFIRNIVWRVAVPAIAEIKSRTTLEKHISNAASLLTLVVGISMSGIAVVIYCLESYGPIKWHGIGIAFPALAINQLINAVFSLTCAALVVASRAKELAVFHALFVGVALTSFIIIGQVDVFYGLWVSEIIACLAYVYLYNASKKDYPDIYYRYSIFIASVLIASFLIGAHIGSILTVVIAIVVILSITHTRELIHQTISDAFGTKQRLKI